MAGAAQEIQEYQTALGAVVEKAREEGVPFTKILGLVEGYGSKEGLKGSAELAKLVEVAAKERAEALDALAEDDDADDVEVSPEIKGKIARAEAKVVARIQSQEKERARIAGFNAAASKQKKDDGLDVGFLSNLGKALIGIAAVSKLSGVFSGAAADPAAKTGFAKFMSRFTEPPKTGIAAESAPEAPKAPTAGTL